MSSEIRENFMYPTSYARLGGNYNSPLFSPCVSKRCAGGPYMYTSSPYLQAVCQGVTNSELSQIACARGANGGKPIPKFEFDALSNNCWNNALCASPTRCSLCIL